MEYNDSFFFLRQRFQFSSCALSVFLPLSIAYLQSFPCKGKFAADGEVGNA